MSDDIDQPFDSIEGAQEYMSLLAATIQENILEMQRDRARAIAEGQERRVQALDLALYKIKQLNTHVHKSGRILNDLRSVRRLLLSERAIGAVSE